MRIENGKSQYSLEYIDDGEVFEHDNTLYLKTDELIDGVRTCVRLGDGAICTFTEDCLVYKCTAKVVIG